MAQCHKNTNMEVTRICVWRAYLKVVDTLSGASFCLRGPRISDYIPCSILLASNLVVETLGPPQRWHGVHCLSGIHVPVWDNSMKSTVLLSFEVVKKTKQQQQKTHRTNWMQFILSKVQCKIFSQNALHPFWRYTPTNIKVDNPDVRILHGNIKVVKASISGRVCTRC